MIDAGRATVWQHTVTDSCISTQQQWFCNTHHLLNSSQAGRSIQGDSIFKEHMDEGLLHRDTLLLSYRGVTGFFTGVSFIAAHGNKWSETSGKYTDFTLTQTHCLHCRLTTCHQQPGDGCSVLRYQTGRSNAC